MPSWCDSDTILCTRSKTCCVRWCDSPNSAAYTHAPASAGRLPNDWLPAAADLSVIGVHYLTVSIRVSKSTTNKSAKFISIATTNTVADTCTYDFTIIPADPGTRHNTQYSISHTSAHPAASPDARSYLSTHSPVCISNTTTDKY